MKKKIQVILLAAAIILIGLYAAKSHKTAPIEDYPYADNPPVNPAFNVTLCANKDCWFKEGSIYETHPYYYPNHSFKEITEQIPSIADLGIKTIYILPVFEHENKDPSYNYLYLIDDYYKIDPAYGTEADLKELVRTAHNYHMKVLFDMVTAVAPAGSVLYNWTIKIPLQELEKSGLDLKFQNIGAGSKDTYSGRFVYSSDCFKSKTSPSFCKISGKVEGNDVVIYTYPNPKFGPALDRTDPHVIEYFTNVAEYYVKNYDIDGLRLDSTYNTWNPELIPGDHSIIRLSESMKSAIIKIKPDAVFVAEHPSPELDTTADMSYVPYEFWFNMIGKDIVSGNMTSMRLIDALDSQPIRYNRSRVYFGETHDSPRFNKIAPQADRSWLVFISTIPGIPMIQAGQEIGSTNEWFAAGNKAKPQVDWAGGNNGLRDFYKKVFAIRNSSDALKYGDIKNVWKSGDNTFAYSRTYEKETAIVVINYQRKAVSSGLNIPFPKSTKMIDELSGEMFTIDNPSDFKITIPAYGSRILVIKR